jgi:hypothetical protein
VLSFGVANFDNTSEHTRKKLCLELSLEMLLMFFAEKHIGVACTFVFGYMWIITAVVHSYICTHSVKTCNMFFTTTKK